MRLPITLGSRANSLSPCGRKSGRARGRPAGRQTRRQRPGLPGRRRGGGAGQRWPPSWCVVCGVCGARWGVWGRGGCAGRERGPRALSMECLPGRPGVRARSSLGPASICRRKKKKKKKKTSRESMRTLLQFKHRFLGFRHLDLQSAACIAGVVQGQGEEEAEEEQASGGGEPATDDGDADLAPLPPSPHAPLRLRRADPADPVATPFWVADFPDEATATAVAGRASLVKVRKKERGGARGPRHTHPSHPTLSLSHPHTPPPSSRFIPPSASSTCGARAPTWTPCAPTWRPTARPPRRPPAGRRPGGRSSTVGGQPCRVGGRASSRACWPR